MTGVLTLLLGAGIVGLYGHRPLLWLADRRVDPTVLLTGWVLLTVGLVGSTVAMIGLLALPADDHPATGFFRLAGGCWTAVAAGTMPGWRQAFAAISVALTLIIVTRLSFVTAARLRLRSQQAPHVRQLLLLAAGAPSDAPLWVDDDRAMAMSIGGRPGLILMTEGLRRQLPPDAVEATLEHERAHLRGHHHVLVSVVETMAAALPWCPLLRAAPAATKDLIELAADAQAARRCGPEAVQTALRLLTGHPNPPLGLAMANRLTEVRMNRLHGRERGTSHLLRWAGCAAMTVGALALPLATGWLGMNIVGCVVT
ncbi:M56 family metallopeptidase [Modestobacter altitudinis]|uniref:M56 family metallopeptidase n=1 Tax=Modestobacter altitudinis TaxID=2213158 RepID=UPI00110CE6AB|nr:M56 family metallopeptidase [Modestobacter altitudinis]